MGAPKFVDNACACLGNLDVIVCPCRYCKNLERHHFDIVYEHLVIKGIDPSYTNWVLHGESSIATIQYEGERNTYRSNQYIDFEMIETCKMYRDQACFQEANATKNTCVGREEFQNLTRDAETPLYPGCTTYSKMVAIATLFKHKVAQGYLIAILMKCFKFLVICYH